MSNKTENDYSNQYIHTGKLPAQHISNLLNLVEGYPKLQRLRDLKQMQLKAHLTKPYGCKLEPKQMALKLNYWNQTYGLQFDVIMIGGLDSASAIPILKELPLSRLCAKPGYLFIWATQGQIIELTHTLNEALNKKFRRSEELIFLPIDPKSKAFPTNDLNSMFRNEQWHCWMCITGTVRRSSDQHLIHCNIDTDLQFETPQSPVNNVVPDVMYKVAENFSNSNRRLHIIPFECGYNLPIKTRPGWVIMSPDVLLNNFNPTKYEKELHEKSVIHYKNNQVQYLVGSNSEIDDLRPKSPSKLSR